MNTLLNNTYLQTAGILNQITALIKKTATTQLEIGKLILTVKNDYYTKLDAFKSDPKNETAIALKDEYEDFLNSLPFGKVVANKFAKIAADPMIIKYIDNAPQAYNVLYSLVGTAEPMWKFFKENETHSHTTAGQLNKLKTEYNTSTADGVPTEEDQNDEIEKAISSGEALGKEPNTNVNNLVVEPDNNEVMTTLTTTIFSNEDMPKKMLQQITSGIEKLVMKVADSHGLMHAVEFYYNDMPLFDENGVALAA